MSQTSSPISVCRADSGADFEVNMSNDTTVEHLKLRLAELTSIPVEHQILVCDDGTKLVQQKTLSEYGFPSKERRIFLYDKRQLLGDASMVSSQRDAANLIVAPLQVPSKPQFVPNKSESQQIRDLRQYVLEFSYHVEYAKSVVAAIEKRVKVIFQLQTEQKKPKTRPPSSNEKSKTASAQTYRNFERMQRLHHSKTLRTRKNTSKF